MTFPVFLGIFAIVIQSILAFMVLAKEPGRAQNRIFSLQLLLFCGWSGAELYLIHRGIDAFGIKLLFTPALLLPYVFCIFTAIYPEHQAEASIIKSRRHLFLYFLPAVALLYLLWSGQLIKGYEAIAQGFSLDLGRYEFVVKGVLIGYLFLSLSTLSNSRKNAETTIQIRRLRYTFAAMLLPIAAGSMIIAFSKWFIGGTTMYAFGLFPVLSIIMSIILAYTMLRYNLMEIDVIFSIGLVYTLLTAIMAGIMELFQELMQNILDFSGLWSKIITVLIIAAIFSPVKDFLIRLVDRFFGRQTFDSARVLQTIVSELRKMPDREKLFARLLDELNLVIDYSGARLQIGDKQQLCLPENLAPIKISERFATLPSDINEIDAIIQYFISSKDQVMADASRTLKDLNIRHLFNIADNERHYGFMLLNAKNSKVPFTATEISLTAGLIGEIPHLLNNLQMISRLLDQEKVSQEVDWAKKLLHAISAAETTCFCGMPLARFASLSHEIKGDMLDLCEDENNSFIGVYDAFHHGIPAVLTLNIMYAVMRCFNETKTQLQQVNRVLRQFTQELCSAATIIRIKQRHIELANAGNPSPLVISHKGVKRIFEQPSRPVGYEKDIQLQLSSFELAEGELLFCSTNGVYKAFEHLYGKSLEQFIDETCDHPEELHSRISQAISSLTRQNFSDDITFITAGQP